MERSRGIAGFVCIIIACIGGVAYNRHQDHTNQLFSLSAPEGGTLVTATPGARCERGNLITGARVAANERRVRYSCSAPLSWPRSAVAGRRRCATVITPRRWLSRRSPSIER